MAQIYLGRPVFYRRGESGMSAVVGIENHMARIARYEITAPSIGASSVSFRFVGWSDAGGTRPSYLRCYIGTDPSSHTDANANSPYTCRLSRSGSAFVGSADIVLLPSTRYYVWVFPDDFSTYGWLYWSAGAQDGTMETSGAAATDLSGSSGTLGSSHTLSLHRYSSAASHTLTAVCNGDWMTVATGVQSDSYTWVPPIGWAGNNATGSSVPVTVICKTFIGGQEVGSSSISVTMRIPDSVVPGCSITVSDPTGLLGELGTYVQGKSKVRIQSVGKGVYGSWTVGFEVSCGDARSDKNDVTFELPTSGSIKITVRAVDSRGRYGIATQTINVAPYHVPQAEILKVYRCQSTGVPDMTADYACIKIRASVDPLVAGTAKYVLKERLRRTDYWTNHALDQYDGKQALDDAGVIIPADPGQEFEYAIQVSDRWPPARVSPYRSLSLAFALLQVDKAHTAIGIGQQAGPDNTVSIGLQTIMNAPLTVAGMLARAIIPAGEDADHYTDPGIYSTDTNANAKQIKNLPTDIGGLLWVYNAFGDKINSGPWVYITQIYRPYLPSYPTYRRLIESNGNGVWKISGWFSDAGAASAAIMENV